MENENRSEQEIEKADTTSQSWPWGVRKWKEEIDVLAMEMWLGDRLARTVGVLSIDTFDEDYRPVKLATAAIALKVLKYKIKEETTHHEKARLGLSRFFKRESN